MIVIDTTVLVYAVGERHPLRDPCRRLLTAHRDGLVDARTTPEVVQEFVHVRGRRRDRTDASQLGRHYAEALSLMVSTSRDLELGLSLYERCAGLGAFDALLAGVALNSRADALVSADAGFADVPGLRWIDPAGSEFEQILDAGE